MKRHILESVRKYCPDAKILELYQPYVGRVLENADSDLDPPLDVPKELADRVNELANDETIIKSKPATN